jgi:hypothetical protein
MKYEAPNADVIDLRAMESVALLDGHPDARNARNGDSAPTISGGYNSGDLPPSILP